MIEGAARAHPRRATDGRVVPHYGHGSFASGGQRSGVPVPLKVGIPSWEYGTRSDPAMPPRGNVPSQPLTPRFNFFWPENRETSASGEAIQEVTQKRWKGGVRLNQGPILLKMTRR